jgi:integrase
MTESAYVFPVLHDSMSPTKQLNEKKLFLQVINKYMKRIGTKLGIETKLTTYVARHTFATVLNAPALQSSLLVKAWGIAT